MPPGFKRDAYSDAINKVRSEHSGSIKHANLTVECPRCRTKQVITDAPGMRVCVKCGFEFRPMGR
jgi:ribosomal protein S27E